VSQTVAELIRISAEQRRLAVHQLHRFSASRQTCTDLSKCALRVQHSYFSVSPLQPERLSIHLVSGMQDFVNCTPVVRWIRCESDARGACRMSARNEGTVPSSVPAEAGPVGPLPDQVASNGMSSSTTPPMNGLAAGVLRGTQQACMCFFSMASIVYVCAALMLVASLWTWGNDGSNNCNACNVKQSVVLQRGFPGQAWI
jgi:hypothetical protein